MCYLDTVKINCEGEVGKNANKKIYMYIWIQVNALLNFHFLGAV